MFIELRGVRQHNLKNFNLNLPHYKLIGICGVSGSGKSSLAFHVLHAEGQRRYLETFSPYIRQFFERLNPPDVDSIENIPPSIALESGTTVRNARSTVGTITEINDYLKYLFAYGAEPYCPKCKKAFKPSSPDEIIQYLNNYRKGDRFYILAPWNSGPLEKLIQLGFARIYYHGKVYNLHDDSISSDFTSPVYVVVDRVLWGRVAHSRLIESLSSAFSIGQGKLAIAFPEEDELLEFTSDLSCPYCGFHLPEPRPELFSFNSPIGACPECRGFGRVIGFDMDRVVPNKSKSLLEGAIKPWSPGKLEYYDLLSFCGREGIPLDVPFEELPAEDRNKIINGTKDFYGIKGYFQWLERKTYKTHVRVFLSKYRSYVECTFCRGTRYSQQTGYFKLSGHTIYEIQALSAEKCLHFFENNPLKNNSSETVNVLIEEVTRRLKTLVDLRLGYLTLDRPSRTLSGGEIQRVHLVKVLGSSLSNVLYVIDEPSVGLHPRDQEKLLEILRDFVERRNTVILVDHDPEILNKCHYLVELGPGGGSRGGEIVASGTPSEVASDEASITGTYLKKPLPIFANIEARKKRVNSCKEFLRIKGAREFNLKNINVEIPLGCITAVSGVSGAGKTTLVETTLYGNWRVYKGLHVDFDPGECDTIEGFEILDEIILIDRKPVAKTPRANLLTFSGAFSYIRNLFADTDEAKSKGFGPGHFSFNRPGGRCEVCRGEGFERFEMQFLADIYSQCPACKGKRFKDEILQIKYCGWSIADFLEATASDVLSHFSYDEKLKTIFSPFVALNLHRIKLGQPLATLSAGESQRLKLLSVFKKTSSTGKKLLIIDEPSRGLHPQDVKGLISVFNKLVERGCSLIVVEHNPIILMACDWIIDLGPEGGDKGGEVIFQGTPEELLKDGASITGKCLRTRLKPRKNKELKIKALDEKKPNGGIELKGVRHHNLQIKKLTLPLNKFVVLTGVSGSGKSSLAFDVLHAEGQRRYIECLSNYIRQFFTVFSKPDVDSITSLPPTVAIGQMTSKPGQKSTVGTITEIYHFLRLLYSQIGVQRCISCGHRVEPLSVDSIISEVRKVTKREKVKILAPIVYRRKGIYRDLISRLTNKGYSEARIDGKWKELKDINGLSRFDHHTIEVVIPFSGKRDTDIVDTISKALQMGQGFIVVYGMDSGREYIFSRSFYCVKCGIGYLPLDPRLFSFNSSYGACPDCNGTGILYRIASDKLKRMAEDLRNDFCNIWFNAPFIPSSIRRIWKKYKDFCCGNLERFLRGSNGIPGLLDVLNELLMKGKLPDEVVESLGEELCNTCCGSRINDQARAVEVSGYTIPQLVEVTIDHLGTLLKGFNVLEIQRPVFEQTMSEILKRIEFLKEVGLDYLTLNRSGDTLSGGEMQRIKLAASLGSELSGVLYVLDEPTIGLHPVDNRKLLRALKRLKDKGNSVLVVEHDIETMMEADLLVELGTGGGSFGGRVTAIGNFYELLNCPDTAIHKAFSSKAPVYSCSNFSKWLTLHHVKFRNLKDITVKIPLRTITCVTGVSGSGKSTLLFDVIYPRLCQLLGQKKWLFVGKERCGAVEGAEELYAVQVVDHKPIGRTPRSIPATYLGIWNYIRNVFASLPEAKALGLSPPHFSFNVASGRCPICSGLGVVIEKMNFLPDVERTCPGCDGKRFNSRVLSVKYRSNTIADVLNMTFQEAQDFFTPHSRLFKTIKLVNELGLGYIKLGQASPTLSGGEAQRIKLAKELVKNSKPTMFLLDEPTTGLHALDIEKLVKVLRKLVDKGHTVVVIEHNMDFVRTCDYVIDLGPGSGQKGGRIVGEGRPSEFEKFKHFSATARCMNQFIKGDAYGS